MTTITTNLVVALMIVSNGMEKIKMVPLPPGAHDGAGHWIVDCRQMETVEKKMVRTNFVYSTEIRTCMKFKCCDCKESSYRWMAPCEFLGKPIESIFFADMPDMRCKDCGERVNKIIRQTVNPNPPPILRKDDNSDIFNMLKPEDAHRVMHQNIELACRYPGVGTMECPYPFCRKLFRWNRDTQTVVTCERSEGKE